MAALTFVQFHEMKRDLWPVAVQFLLRCMGERTSIETWDILLPIVASMSDLTILALERGRRTATTVTSMGKSTLPRVIASRSLGLNRWSVRVCIETMGDTEELLQEPRYHNTTHSPRAPLLRASPLSVPFSNVHPIYLRHYEVSHESRQICAWRIVP